MFLVVFPQRKNCSTLVQLGTLPPLASNPALGNITSSELARPYLNASSSYQYKLYAIISKTKLRLCSRLLKGRGEMVYR